MLTCDITGLAHGGAGVARVDGRVVFVTGALPGETVRVEVTDDSRSSWWRGRTVDIVSPSPDRTPVSCPAAAAGAGCCDLAYGTVAAIRRAKTTILSDALTRIGRLEPPTGLAVEAIGEESGHDWRIRARLGVGPSGAVGFRAAHGTAIVDAPCAALTASLADAIAELGGRRGRPDAGDLAPGSEVLAVHDDDGGVHLAVLAGAGAQQKGAGRAAAQRRRARHQRALRPRILSGSATVRYRVGPRTWDLPVQAFWQAHRGAPEVYSRTAAGWLAEAGVTGAVWDLYGGAGVFAGAALDSGADRVTIVDTAADVLAAAGRVFDGRAVTTRRGPVTPGALAELPPPAAVVLDPPRSGAGTAVMDAVVAAAPDAIVHVGCDPAAFARDVGRAVAGGYRLAKVRGFDAFPLTHHVEAMGLLVLR
ncbi:putative RNA methyltransferase [Gordonia araii NBRC 100433]|uniref:Putative RNA methyltransferase n=1 Tax=Gordonia araii NBRC 100433 TaxID=1073574 RepID=G7H5J2_9ACTN|nr:putative RNA methyltransferase [Gordonia araii NBRC 100433]